MKWYVKSANKKPERTQIYVKLARTHEKLREFDEAIVYLKKALRREPTHFGALYRLGVVQIRNNLRDEGVKSLKQALEQKPNDYDCLLKLAEIYVRDNDNIKQTKDIINKLLSIRPESAEGHILFGRLYEKEENTEAALEEFKIALEISNQNKNDKKGNINANFFLGC